MTQQYLMEYVDEYDFTRTVSYKIVSAECGLTWRELQQKFDSSYRYDNLKFFILGEKVL